MGKFGNIDEAKAKASLNAEIKSMLMLLFQMFSGARQNTANKIHNFIPHLKRTDRDCGSLPFYSRTFTSMKTNKEHILLSMISMVVQTYWDIVDSAKTVDIKVIDEFSDVMAVLNEISKGSIDNFGVYGTNFKFSLMSKDRLDEIEVEQNKKEQREAEQKEDQEQQARKDEAEGKKLMEAELGSAETQSQDSDSLSTQSDVTEADGSDEEIFEEAAGAANGAAPLALVENVDDSSSSVAPDETASTKDGDQVSTEDADACSGDCDSCVNPACQTNQTNVTDDPDELDNEPADEDEGAPDQSEVDEAEREDNLEGAEVGVGDCIGAAVIEESGDTCCLDCQMEDQRKADDDDDVADCAAGDVTNIPGSLADEQGGNTIPPMPEEEKDSQAAVDHETGDDQVSEPPAPPEKVEVKRKTD